MRTLSITVSADMAGRKVKSILRREFKMAEGHIARLKLRPGGITLSGRPCRTVDTVAEGDVLRVEVGDAPRKSGAAPLPLPLTVVYEDEDCVVVDKPPRLACHGASEKGEATLAAALAHRYGPDSAYHPVSRLDKGTSGLCCSARSGYAHTLFMEKLHTEDYHREYLLICSPPPKKREGVIDLPIGREEGSSIKRCIRPDGARAVTEYELLAEEKGLALVRARLRTGRTHQIRLHFAAIGCPLVGDWLYGEASEDIDRPALHSAFLKITQPVTGERICLLSPLPADMAALAPSFTGAAEKAFSKGYE